MLWNYFHTDRMDRTELHRAPCRHLQHHTRHTRHIPPFHLPSSHLRFASLHDAEARTPAGLADAAKTKRHVLVPHCAGTLRRTLLHPAHQGHGAHFTLACCEEDIKCLRLQYCPKTRRLFLDLNSTHGSMQFLQRPCGRALGGRGLELPRSPTHCCHSLRVSSGRLWRTVSSRKRSLPTPRFTTQSRRLCV